MWSRMSSVKGSKPSWHRHSPDRQGEPSPRNNERLCPPRDSSRIAAREIAVTRQRPQRKIFRIAVRAQIEHARKASRGIARLVPQTVGALALGKIFDAAPDRRMIEPARGDEAEHGPGGLRRRRRRRLVAVVVELVARSILAPAAVRILD